MRTGLFSAFGLSALLMMPVSADPVVRNDRTGSLVLESVEVRPGAKFLFVGGIGGVPTDPKARENGYGDTKSQMIVAMKKMQAILEKRGYSMSDLIKLNAFVVADPAIGKADYEGVNAGFREFFRTAANPSSVVRTAVEIKAIQVPGLFVEIEGVAAK